MNGRCAVLPQNPMALLSQISVEEELASAVMDKGECVCLRIWTGNRELNLP